MWAKPSLEFKANVALKLLDHITVSPDDLLNSSQVVGPGCAQTLVPLDTCVASPLKQEVLFNSNSLACSFGSVGFCFFSTSRVEIPKMCFCMLSAFMLKQNYLKGLFLKFTPGLTLRGKENKNSNCVSSQWKPPLWKQ